MRTYIFGTLLLLSACAPLSPSIPKSQVCSRQSQYQSRYDSVIVNEDTWNSVLEKMVKQPISSDGDTQVYQDCGVTMTFEFNGNVLVSKRME